MSGTYIDQIAVIIKRVEADAEARGYKRGVADAKREMLQHLTGALEDSAQYKSEATDFPVERDESKTTATDRPASERKRAPKGLVPKFVKRVLGSVDYGLSPHEIHAYAEDDFERMIKPASIRSELRNGKKEGRYAERNGKWFLVSSEAEGRSGPDEPSASDDNNGGKSDAAALDFPSWE